MKVYSIFSSIQGEVNYMGQGTWVTFIRLAGCNLRCSYCDTKYAQDESKGIDMSVEQILSKIKMIGIENIMITGGEPLHQDLNNLLHSLYFNKYQVTIETNGSISPHKLARDNWKAVQCWVVDYKLPSSEEGGTYINEWDKQLTHKDYIKFVICNKQDYICAKDKIRAIKRTFEHLPSFPPRLALSPVYNILSVKRLMDWMRKDKLFDVQINVQIHKIVVPNEPG